MSILEKTYLIDNIHYAITDEEAVHLRLMNGNMYLGISYLKYCGYILLKI